MRGEGRRRETEWRSGLNADFLDGYSASHFALASELLAAIATLGLPDPPCSDVSHRFVDCGNGTVTDTVTGLIWLKNAGCFGSSLNYVAGNAAAAALFDGATSDPAGGDCGLGDGSRPGDWRLPTNDEAATILHPTCFLAPKIIGNSTPTTACYSSATWASGTRGDIYLTATTPAGNATWVYGFNTSSGNIGIGGKSALYSVWPVRSSR